MLVEVEFEYLGAVPFQEGAVVEHGRIEVRTVDTCSKVTISSVFVMVVLLSPPMHGITVETNLYVEQEGSILHVVFVHSLVGVHVDTAWYCDVTVIGVGAQLSGQLGHGDIVARAEFADTAVESPRTTQSADSRI